MSGKFKYVIPVSAALIIVLILIFVQIRHGRESLQSQQAEERERAGPELPEDMPADQNAFYGTYRIREPEKRLEALNKFISDFPESDNIWSAYREIFKLTIEIWPDDRKRMLAAAAPAEYVEDTIDKSVGYQFIAKELFKAKIFLDEAERFASESVSLLDKDLFIEKRKKKYQEDQSPVPSDSELNEKYLKELASYRTTLARIYLETGRVSKGEKILEEAYDVDPTIAQAAIGLAEIAEGRGKDSRALAYLTTASLTAGDAMEDARNRIETLYRKTHGGSLDGLETMLDAAYRRLFPNPVKVEPYTPAVARSQRVVLLESFTGAG